jgi:hypothetical protein
MCDIPEIEALTICSSTKFYPAADRLSKELAQCGVVVHTPRFDYNEEFIDVTVADKITLTQEFLGKVRRSDAIYVIAEAGYTGRSVCIEVGYASALRKFVILSEPATEAAIAALTNAIIPIDQFPSAIRR